VTKRGAVVLAVIGAVGLLTLGTLVAVGAAQGQFGVNQNLTLANCGPRHPQGTVVHVGLTDRGGAMMGPGGAMMVSIVASPDIVASGTVTFVATNTGALSHELLVLAAPADGVGTRPVGADGKIDESTSLGEASTSCGQGPGGGISPGTTSWVTLHLAPGNYELLCDDPWHYANGMFTGFSAR
jgi:uncharacterized cupredoxin-like copper-binding protein